MNNNHNNLPREPLGRITGRISRVFFGALQNRLSHLDIERSFYPLLLIHAGKNELTQQELANELMTDKVQVVRIVNYLSKAGYVKRVQNQKDKRQYKLYLTNKGEEAIPHIQQVVNELSNIAFQKISDKKVNDLYFLFGLIERNLLCLKSEAIK